MSLSTGARAHEESCVIGPTFGREPIRHAVQCDLIHGHFLQKKTPSSESRGLWRTLRYYRRRPVWTNVVLLIGKLSRSLNWFWK